MKWALMKRAWQYYALLGAAKSVIAAYRSLAVEVRRGKYPNPELENCARALDEAIQKMIRVVEG